MRIVLGIVVILIALVLVSWLLIDSIAKTAVEKGTTYALDVETQLAEMSIDLLKGKVMMDGLTIANPEGFVSDHLMHSGRFDLEVTPASVLSDTVEVKRFELDGLDVNIEQKLNGSNVSKVLKNLKRLAGGKKQDNAEKPQGDEERKGKKIKVNTIVIKNVVAHFHLIPKLIPGGPLTVRVPEIRLENVTSDDSPGLRISELVAKLMPAILKGIFEQAEGTVPSEFLNDLDGQLTSVTKALSQQVSVMTQKVEEATDKAIKEGKKALEEAGATVEQFISSKKIKTEQKDK